MLQACKESYTQLHREEGVLLTRLWAHLTRDFVWFLWYQGNLCGPMIKASADSLRDSTLDYIVGHATHHLEHLSPGVLRVLESDEVLTRISARYSYLLSSWLGLGGLNKPSRLCFSWHQSLFFEAPWISMSTARNMTGSKCSH